MPPRQPNAMESMFQIGAPEEQQFLQLLLTKDYRTLKMVHEVEPGQVFPMSVLGVVQRRFGSKVLKMTDEEFMCRVKSKDRKGITELVEWAMSMRRAVEEE